MPRLAQREGLSTHAQNGLVTYINSGNGGGMPPSGWAERLDAHQLIWVAGDAIGNSVAVSVRIGKAILAVYRMAELFNIDLARIYASGNSGGARCAQMMAFLHPNTFPAAFPKCGSAFIREVEQAYETHEPDSHYEFWDEEYFPDVNGEDYATYLLSFRPRYALMTSYDDFREGDLMNIYHHGMEADGFESRFLDVAGAHCATDGQHVDDAIHFLEHPLFTVLEDEFDDGDARHNDGTGDGFLSIGTGTAQEQNGELQLTAQGGQTAAVVSRNRLHWYDPKGLIVRLRLSVGEQAQGVYLGLWSQPPEALLDPEANGFIAGLEPAPGPGLMLRVDTGGESATVALRVFGQEAGPPELLFEAPFDDWEPSAEPLPLKLQLWDQELQVNLGKHVGSPSIQDGARLLDDQRTIRVRWAEIQPGYWSSDSWSAETGCLLTAATRGADAEPNGAALALQRIQVIDATGILCE